MNSINEGGNPKIVRVSLIECCHVLQYSAIAKLAKANCSVNTCCLNNKIVLQKVKTVEIGVQTEPERCCSKAVQVTPVAAVSLLCIRCQASVLPISPVDLTNDENEDNNVFEVSDMPSVFPPFLQTFSVQRPDALPSTPTLIECPAAEQLASLPTSSLLSSLPPVPTLRGEQTEESKCYFILLLS